MLTLYVRSTDLSLDTLVLSSENFTSEYFCRRGFIENQPEINVVPTEASQSGKLRHKYAPLFPSPTPVQSLRLRRAPSHLGK